MTFEGAGAYLGQGSEAWQSERKEDFVGLPKTLYEALRPLQEQTGVDFCRYITSCYNVEPHPQAIDPKTGGKAKQEEVRSSVENIEDLGPYFRDRVEGRKYFLLLGRLDHPDKPEELQDFVIMEEPLEDGATALVIFEYPGSPYWTKEEIMIDGKPVNTDYLKLRFAAIMLPKESEDEDWKVTNDTEPLFQDSKLIAAGLLPKEQELSSGYDGIINSRWCLLKDKEDADSIITPSGPAQLPYSHFLEPILLRAAMLYGDAGKKMEQRGFLGAMQELLKHGTLPEEFVPVAQVGSHFHPLRRFCGVLSN